VPGALQGLPAEVRDGSSRVSAFIYRIPREDGTVNTQVEVESREEEGKEEEEEEEQWRLEDEQGLFGFKVDSEEDWVKYRGLLVRDPDLQKRPIVLLLHLGSDQPSVGSQGTSGMHELHGMERATQAVPGDGGRREGVHGQEDGGSELSGEAGLGGWVEGGGRGAEGMAASRPREPLKQVVVMCYYGNSDPIKIQQNVEVSTREKARFFEHAP
jgi:hypothetical protein